MTQVIGINNSLTTDGFYVDNAGATHGFFHSSNGGFTRVDFPNTPFNQLLGQNDMQQAAATTASARQHHPGFPLHL